MRLLLLTLGLASCAFGSAQAGMPHPQEMKCAVGNEAFTHIGTDSYTTWGSRPDGKPYGSWRFPQALPVCPGNGLVMYRDFSKDELARLKTLIGSPDYRAMVARDTPYFRAAWLERSLKPDSGAIAWMTLSASWEADGIPDLKASYQRAFVDLAAIAKPAPKDLEWLFLQMRAANALRELGEFNAALSLVRAIPRDQLAVVVPKRSDSNYEAVRDAERRAWLPEYLTKLEAAIRRSDSSSEPLDLVPERIAAGKCFMARKTGESLSPANYCQSPAILNLIAEHGEEFEAEEDE